MIAYINTIPSHEIATFETKTSVYTYPFLNEVTSWEDAQKHCSDNGYGDLMVLESTEMESIYPQVHVWWGYYVHLDAEYYIKGVDINEDDKTDSVMKTSK